MIALFRLLLSLMTTPFKPMFARGGKRGPAAAAKYLASRVEVAAQTDKFGPLVFCCPLSAISIDPQRYADHPTRDPVPMASIWFPVLLALEVSASHRTAENRRRITRDYQADE